MKKRILPICLLVLILTFSFDVFAKDAVKINASNFPDSCFRKMVSDRYDTDHNGVLSAAEMDSVTTIDTNEKYLEIKDLTGISFFTNLQLIDLCSDGKVERLPVEKNINLIEIRCTLNDLTYLDVSTLKNLEQLKCANNKLTSLKFGNNPKLKYIDCGNDWGSEISNDNNNNKLTKLDLRGLVDLRCLYCQGNNITSLSLPKENSKLWLINCENNKISSLNIGKALGLKQLYCYGNRLTELDTSKAPGLVWLDCSRNKLRKIKYCTDALSHLDIQGNPLELKSIEFKNLEKLEYVNLDENQFKTVVVKNCPKLKELYCNKNQITSFIAEGCPELDWLCVDSNKLTKLDVSEFKKLTVLSCEHNLLTSLKTDENVLLEILDCSDNLLTSLKTDKNVRLKTLSCSDNKITSLDFSKNSRLRQLDCIKNQLVCLDLSKNKKLKRTKTFVYGNKRTVKVSKGKIKLSKLPNFNIKKASKWKGGKVKGKYLIVKKKKITYKYNCGNGRKEKFTLIIKKK